MPQPGGAWFNYLAVKIPSVSQRHEVARRRCNPPCLVAAGVQQRLVNAESDCLRNTPGMRDLTMDAVTEHRLLFDDHDAGTMAGKRQS